MGLGNIGSGSARSIVKLEAPRLRQPQQANIYTINIALLGSNNIYNIALVGRNHPRGLCHRRECSITSPSAALHKTPQADYVRCAGMKATHSTNYMQCCQLLTDTGAEHQVKT